MLQKLYYNRIDIQEGINIVKSSNSKECVICHYWFFNHGFEFQDTVCNGCHDLNILCLNLSDIAIVTVKGFDYSYISNYISKSKTIYLLEISILEDLGYI